MNCIFQRIHTRGKITPCDRTQLSKFGVRFAPCILEHIVHESDLLTGIQKCRLDSVIFEIDSKRVTANALLHGSFKDSDVYNALHAHVQAPVQAPVQTPVQEEEKTEEPQGTVVPIPIPKPKAKKKKKPKKEKEAKAEEVSKDVVVVENKMEAAKMQKEEDDKLLHDFDLFVATKKTAAAKVEEEDEKLLVQFQEFVVEKQEEDDKKLLVQFQEFAKTKMAEKEEEVAKEEELDEKDKALISQFKQFAAENKASIIDTPPKVAAKKKTHKKKEKKGDAKLIEKFNAFVQTKRAEVEEPLKTKKKKYAIAVMLHTELNIDAWRREAEEAGVELVAVTSIASAGDCIGRIVHLAENFTNDGIDRVVLSRDQDTQRITHVVTEIETATEKGQIQISSTDFKACAHGVLLF